jgi:hypothetical protein
VRAESRVTLKDLRAVREHDDISSAQGLVGQKLRNRIRDLARRSGLERGFGCCWLSPSHLRAADTTAALELRKRGVVVPVVSGIVRLWCGKEPKETGKILRGDRRGKEREPAEPGSKRSE